MSFPCFLMTIFRTFVTNFTFTTHMQFYITIVSIFTTVGLSLCCGYCMSYCSNPHSSPCLHWLLKWTIDLHLKECLQIGTWFLSHSGHFPLGFSKCAFRLSIFLIISSIFLNDTCDACIYCTWDDKLLNYWSKECSDETLSISQKTHL